MLGWWTAEGGAQPGRLVTPDAAAQALWDTAYLVESDDGVVGALGGVFTTAEPGSAEALRVLGWAPPMPPAQLGSASFRADHGLRYAYAAGAMANGIASEAVVAAMARAGMLGFFGSAGLSVARIEQALATIQRDCAGRPHGFNLINNINEPALEAATVDAYLAHGVRLVEASAYVALTNALVRYRVTGIHRGPDGRVVAPNRIIAKLSRVEVAERFFAPPPARTLKKLVQAGAISEEEAQLAEAIPMAQDVTVEADSGGHTDHRPLLVVLPAMLALRDSMQARHKYEVPLRVGAAGGLGTPEAIASAFALGADYVLTGSINQCTPEAGTSSFVRAMLAEARATDVDVAPAADMFEKGITVQVLKKGTRFAQRASRLYDYYRRYSALEDIPQDERAKLEEECFRAPLDDIWQQTRAFFGEHDPRQVEKADNDARHRMALVFRWYLGLSSTWANAGVEDRQDDYQVWCGPAMGAFNDWVRDSPLASHEARHVDAIAHNLLYGAAVVLRQRALAQGAGDTCPPFSRPQANGAQEAAARLVPAQAPVQEVTR